MAVVTTRREEPDVIVVGGGPAGCTAAYLLGRRGHRVKLLEAGDRLGGRTQTLRHGGFAIDTGAFYLGHFYRRSLELVDALGLRSSLVPMEQTSGLFDRGRLRPWRPASPLSLVRLPRARWYTKARAFAVLSRYALANLDDPFDLEALAEADDGRTVADWSRRFLGEAGYRHVAQPTFEPYWLYSAEDGSSLMLTAFLQYTAKLELLALPAGMGSFSEALAQDAAVEVGVRATSVRPDGDRMLVETADGEEHVAAGVVVATDAHAAAELLPASEITDALRSIPYAANVHVASAYRVGAELLSGHPATIHPALPREEPVATLSLLSRKAPGVVKPGWEVIDVYFAEPASRALGPNEAPRAAHEQACRLLGVALPEPSFAHVFDRDRAIVKPPPGHFARMAAAVRQLPPAVALAGDYLSIGIVEGAVRSGQAAADRLHATLLASRRPSARLEHA
jgi:oxygen-dependent protoporphyrinogen oxidase